MVDDHVESADGLARLLRRRGHALEVVYDGASALKAADEFRPEVVFLDLDLPDMDGCAVAECLRQNSDHQSCLLIALTGYGHEGNPQRYREAGFDHHLLKPVDAECLHGFIADRLAKGG